MVKVKRRSRRNKSSAHRNTLVNGLLIFMADRASVFVIARREMVKRSTLPKASVELEAFNP